MNDIRAHLADKDLVRSRSDAVLGGVCSGLGRRSGLRPWPARLLFLLVLMLVPASQLLAYPALWLLMPVEPQTATGGWGAAPTSA